MITSKKGKEHNEPELRPDGWGRFERAVDAAVKSGPHPRSAETDVKKGNKVRQPRQDASKRTADHDE